MFKFGKKKQEEMPNKSATEVETLMGGLGAQLGAAIGPATVTLPAAADPASFVFNTQPGTTMLTPAATEEEATKVADELMARVTDKMIMLQRLKEGRI